MLYTGLFVKVDSVNTGVLVFYIFQVFLFFYLHAQFWRCEHPKPSYWQMCCQCCLLRFFWLVLYLYRLVKSQAAPMEQANPAESQQINSVFSQLLPGSQQLPLFRKLPNVKAFSSCCNCWWQTGSDTFSSQEAGALWQPPCSPDDPNRDVTEMGAISPAPETAMQPLQLTHTFQTKTTSVFPSLSLAAARIDRTVPTPSSLALLGWLQCSVQAVKSGSLLL